MQLQFPWLFKVVHAVGKVQQRYKRPLEQAGAVWRALASGQQVHFLITVKEPGARFYAGQVEVKTSRGGRTRWASVPMTIPAGRYQAVFYRKAKTDSFQG